MRGPGFSESDDFLKAMATDATKFLGDPVENLRLGCRRLMHPATRPTMGDIDLEKFRAVQYTSESHKVKRGVLYEEIIPYLRKFFELYGG
jgi:hypothetical protein